MNPNIKPALLAGTAFILMLSAVPQAMATTLDPVSFGSAGTALVNGVAGNQGDPHFITQFGDYTSSSTVGGATGQATASVSGGVDPALSASIAAAAMSLTSTSAAAFADVQLRYQFDFNGPAASVPMIVGANGSITSSGGGSNAVQLQIFGNGVNINFNIGCFGSTSCTQTFSGQTVNDTVFFTGSVYTVIMSIVLDGGAQGGLAQDQSQTMMGSIDPMFTVDLSNASDFTFDFSSGLIPPASATPLPAALPLFASGMAALGFLARRRKRKAAALAA